ncbi:MAG: WbuC family cupin fold metalloprotein [Prevotellaceae bacterium]|nr:WbuC family cupin fold metalloprotein [Prevotellaceae bacterium]MDD7106986.1 WbuC family cupin fold metalloprotein [Prevotellaceae bacterium]MDY3294825.1 WbuC family cupin fold metalloprotein [Bacteroidaceae bacterium]
MILDKQLLDNLCQQAQTSPRLRMNYDLRTTENDNSQRMLNALEPGTDIPIHRHRDTSETVVMLRGSVKEIFYTIEGGTAYPTAEFILKAGSDNCALQIPQGQWHSLECLEAHSVLFEAKDGAFVPRTDDDVFIPQT